MDSQRVKAVDLDLKAYLIAQEDWHPSYRSNRELFLRLTKAEAMLEQNVGLYFRGLKDRSNLLIDWSEVQNRRAGDVVVSITGDVWDSESKMLYATISSPLVSAAEAGYLMAEAALKLNTGTGVGNANLLKAIRTRTGDLIKGINNTTKDRIREAILNGIQSGETIQQIQERVAAVIDDPLRAELIARTEAVKAASIGQIQTAKDIGAQFKVWEDGQPGACEICANLNGRRVPVDENFVSDYGEFDMPGAHPRCRCGMSLDFANDKEAAALADGSYDPSEDYGD